MNLKSEEKSGMNQEGQSLPAAPRMWVAVTGWDPSAIRAAARSNSADGWPQLSSRSAVEVGKSYRYATRERLQRIIKHFAEGGEALNSWVARIPTLRTAEETGVFLRDTLIGPLAWLGRLLMQVLDLFGVAEVWDLLGQLAKPGTRALSAMEIAEGRKVYGDAITWSKVRVDERSALAIVGRRMLGASGLGLVVGHTIHFSRKIAPQPGNSEMAWLIHELMHVLQCEATGLQYIPEALHAQYAEGYAYGGIAGLQARTFRAFNREQQGDIARDYYTQVVCRGQDPAPWLPHIRAIRARSI